jgi:hypothetical protein
MRFKLDVVWWCRNTCGPGMEGGSTYEEHRYGLCVSRESLGLLRILARRPKGRVDSLSVR